MKKLISGCLTFSYLFCDAHQGILTLGSNFQISTVGLVLLQKVALEELDFDDVTDDATDDVTDDATDDVTDSNSPVHKTVTQEVADDDSELVAIEIAATEEILDDSTAETSEASEKKKRKGFSCDQCDFETSTPYSLKRHQNVHKNVRFYCPQCLKSFSSAYYRDLHESSHDKNEPGHLCHVCAKTFVCNYSLTQHMALHNEKFKCPECGQLFISSAKLRDHAKSHTRGPQTSFKCCKCNETFSTRKRRRKHSRSCGASGEYQCSQCGKMMTMKKNLDRHVRVFHGSEESEVSVCPCGNRYRWKASLVKHKKSCPYVPPTV